MSHIKTTSLPTAKNLFELKANNEKIAIVTCYDATFAETAQAANLDALMVGDSLGMVIQGENTTVKVSLQDMLYHVRMVAKGADQSVIIADLPFGTYHKSPQSAYEAAVEVMKAGATMIKIEGGQWMAPTTEFLSKRGISVCSHIGLTPQSVYQLGGYKVHGKQEQEQKTLLEDAHALQESGAQLIVLEAMPSNLARDITNSLTIPTIGIGAGPDCSGQVLVLYDLLGLGQHKKPRFVQDFLAGKESILQALRDYSLAVKAGTFPTLAHSYK